MHRAVALMVLLLAASLSGCLSKTAPPEAVQPTDTTAAAPDDQGSGSQPAPRGPAPAPPPRPAVVVLPPQDTGTSALPDPGPMVVIAHVDTGINPYHVEFRDASPFAFVHPSRYLPGYPPDVPALRLTLDAATWQDAFARDREVWASVKPGQLYWIPGTRIVGAISFAPGGTTCDAQLVTQPPLPVPVPAPVPVPVPIPQVLPAPSSCTDTPILDDFGHGTMTASRMAAGEHSLCPTCRVVSIEGLGAKGVRWAADQGWIDVQTNSWGDVVPGVLPDNAATGDSAGVRAAFAYAAQRMLVFAASGNGLAFKGGVGDETYAQVTGAQGVVLVGAHDNGYVTTYQGQPPHVVADGYGGFRAARNSTLDFAPSPETCCTSAASPYAAGGAAAILLQARTMLGQRGTGVHNGIAAQGNSTVKAGLLADGKLTLDEWRGLLLRTANARPGAGPDDGLVNPLALAKVPTDPTNPGENPYCPGCIALPVKWSDVDPAVPTYQLLGYGSVDPSSVARAASVLTGASGMPDRSVEDTLYTADQAARGVLDHVP